MTELGKLCTRTMTNSNRIDRCRANMAHIRQSRPDSGLVGHSKVLYTFSFVLFAWQRMPGLVNNHGARNLKEPLSCVLHLMHEKHASCQTLRRVCTSDSFYGFDVYGLRFRADKEQTGLLFLKNQKKVCASPKTEENTSGKVDKQICREKFNFGRKGLIESGKV